MKSMTGFGKGELKNDSIDCSVEIKTVNSRYRDIYLKLPHVLNALDGNIRKLIQDNTNRGKIDVYVSFQNLESNNNNLHVDKNLASQYLDALNQIIDLDPKINPNIDLSLLVGFPDIITVEPDQLNDNELWIMISPVVQEALDNLNKSRSREGDNLKRSIKDHAQIAESIIYQIKDLEPQAFEVSVQNLRDRVQKLLEENTVDENRVLNEIAVLSDKLAIDEEITRLESHIKHLFSLIEEEGPIGRKIDFLIQELNRETNTIGSKTDNLEITNLVVELKSELEKIREQVQNIE